jgi:Txe/YoeB family toxin of Txe-Axe toxin-antitoxin module
MNVGPLLQAEEKVGIYNELKKITFIRPSKDIKIRLQQKKEAIERAKEWHTKIQRDMFKKKEQMKLLQQKAKEAWVLKMKSMRIDHTNMMIKVDPAKVDTIIVGGNASTWSPKPSFVFKKPEIKI